MIGVPILVISILLFAKPAKDLWILQHILPAFLAFGLLLGLSLVLGQSKLVVPNAAIALGLLAIVPSLKYGLVYGDMDGIGHYGAAVQIARTGSVAGATYYTSTQPYAAYPLLHILLAMTGLVGRLPIEATIVCTIFLDHFAIFVMVAESARRMFPRIERQLIVFLTIITLPVLTEITGTCYGALPLATLTYVFSTVMGGRGERRHWLVTTVIMVALIFSHFTTVLYLLVVIIGYTITLFVMRRLGSPRSGVRDAVTDFLPRFLVVFFAWLVYVGQDLVHVMHGIVSDLFTSSPFPSAAREFPLTILFQLFLFEWGRLLFFTLAAAAVLSVGLVRRWKTGSFLLLRLLLVVALVMSGLVGLGVGWEASGIGNVFRYLTYASLVAPYFLCFLFSRRRHTARLHTLRIGFIKAIMLATLVMSMVAAYPITPLYPKAGGQPILDDNSVNTIYALSGIQYFSSVYSSGSVLTTTNIFWQLMCLHPELVHLSYDTIFPGLGVIVMSPAEVHAHATLVLFHTGGKSGTYTLAMRALAPNLRDELGIVYTNGFFYVALAT
jgi:hypothetical protein